MAFRDYLLGLCRTDPAAVHIFTKEDEAGDVIAPATGFNTLPAGSMDKKEADGVKKAKKRKKKRKKKEKKARKAKAGDGDEDSTDDRPRSVVLAVSGQGSARDPGEKEATMKPTKNKDKEPTVKDKADKDKTDKDKADKDKTDKDKADKEETVKDKKDKQDKDKAGKKEADKEEPKKTDKAKTVKDKTDRPGSIASSDKTEKEPKAEKAKSAVSAKDIKEGEPGPEPTEPAATSGEEEGKPDEVVPQKPLKYPYQVFFILAMEACERYSYYGMNSVFIMFVKHLAKEDGDSEEEADDDATVVKHLFTFFNYFFPVLGAILAESWFGMFNIIFVLSIVHLLGNALFAVAAIPPTEAGWPADKDSTRQEGLFWTAFMTMALGTGGIKPCVVPFGATQFVLPDQKAQQDSYFGWFYGAINAGALLSMIISPIMRAKGCMGEETCFTYAFLVPAVLMACSLIFFVLGRPMYRMVVPERNVIWDFIKCSFLAFRRKMRYCCGGGPSDQKDHWLDYAKDEWGEEWVEDCKIPYRLCMIFVFYPFIWCLYDQGAGRWVLQATRMDYQIFGHDVDFYLLPDQTGFFNPLLILAFIPLFDFVIYPVFNKYGMLTTPLQKIGAGGFMVVASFIAAIFLELAMMGDYPLVPKNGAGRLSVYNGIQDCQIRVTFQGPKTLKALTIKGGQEAQIMNDDDEPLLPFKIPDKGMEFTATAKVKAGKNCKSIASDTQVASKVELKKDESVNLAFFPEEGGRIKGYASENPDQIEKDLDVGAPVIRLIYDFNKLEVGKNTTAIFTNADDSEESGEIPLTKKDTLEKNTGDSEAVAQKIVRGRMKMCLSKLKHKETARICAEDANGDQIFDFRLGASYNLYVTDDKDDGSSVMVDMQEITPPNRVNLLWQLIQISIVTAGEVMFSIVGLSFSYSQAPNSMKSIIQSMFLITIALGSVITIVVVEVVTFMLRGVTGRSYMVWEFLIFALITTIALLVYVYVAKYYYTYRYYDDIGPGQTVKKLSGGSGDDAGDRKEKAAKQKAASAKE